MKKILIRDKKEVSSELCKLKQTNEQILEILWKKQQQDFTLVFSEHVVLSVFALVSQVANHQTQFSVPI